MSDDFILLFLPVNPIWFFGQKVKERFVQMSAVSFWGDGRWWWVNDTVIKWVLVQKSMAVCPVPPPSTSSGWLAGVTVFIKSDPQQQHNRYGNSQEVGNVMLLEN